MAHSQIATYYRGIQNWNLELYHHQQARRIEGDTVKNLMNVAVAARRSGASVIAFETIQRARELYPNDQQFLSLQISMLLYAGRAEEAMEPVDLLLSQRPGHPNVIAQKATLLVRLGKPEAALEFLRQHPTVADYDRVLYVTTQALLKLGRPKEAFEKAKALTNGNRGFGPGWSLRAVAASRIRHLGDAVASADRAIALMPDSTIAHFVLARTLVELGRFEEAERAIQKTRPGVSRNLLSVKLYIANEEYRKAEALLRTMAPENAVLIRRAQVYYRLGNFARAQSVLLILLREKSNRLDPEFVAALIKTETAGRLPRSQILAEIENALGPADFARFEEHARQLQWESVGNREETEPLDLDLSDPAIDNR